MKNTLYWILLIVAICHGCTKEDAKTTTTGTTGSTTNTPPTSVSQQTQMMQGNWVMRRQQSYVIVYSNGGNNSFDSIVSYLNYYSPLTCYINLTNTPHAAPGYFNYTGYVGDCTSSTWIQKWKITAPDYVDFDGYTYKIDFLSNDSLVIEDIEVGHKNKFFYNKTGNAPGLSATEQMIAKSWVAYKYELIDTAGVVVNTLLLTPPSSYTVTFTNTWNNSGWKTNGWTGITNGGDWEVVGGGLLLSCCFLYNIDTLNPGSFVVSREVGTSGFIQKYYMH